MDLPGQHIRNRLGFRLVRDVDHLDAGVGGKHRGRDDGVGIAGRVVELLRIGLGVGDQLRDRFRGHRRMHHDEEGIVAEVGDGVKSATTSYGGSLRICGTTPEGTVGAEQERVAVGGRALHLDGGERAVGAGLVDDDDGWPIACDSSWPAMRASASLAEPGPNGRMNLMGFVG